LNITGSAAIVAAIGQCRETGLTGWALVEYAQKLVAGRMTYSYYHSFDAPETAFARGMGYCWQQAGALNHILAGLGVDSRLVHSVRNRFPDMVREGVTVHIGVSGHVWCAVRVDGVEKYVCPGRIENRPGQYHFEILGPVHEFKGPITVFSYFGSAMINYFRGKKFMEQKEKLGSLYIPEKCPCKKRNCERNRNCEACKANHHSNGGKTACERLQAK
jgi:hypothetical protein